MYDGSKGGMNQWGKWPKDYEAGDFQRGPYEGDAGGTWGGYGKLSKAAAAPPGEGELRAGEDGSAEDGNEPPSVEQTGDAFQRGGVCNLLHHGRNFFRCRLCFNVMVQKLPKIDGIPTRRFKHRDFPSTDPRSEFFR